jgi:hypothetical protein
MGVRTRGPDIKAGAAKFRADRAARLEAELVIDRWNRRLATGRDMLWWPTIRAALIAGTPWLDVFCPGCGTSRAIDLRTVDRHPLAPVGTMVPRPAVLMVSGLGTDAEAAWAVRVAAGEPRPRRDCLKQRVLPTRYPRNHQCTRRTLSSWLDVSSMPPNGWFLPRKQVRRSHPLARRAA